MFDFPEKNVFKQEINDAIVEVVNKLSDDIRMTILLREKEGLTYEEIASVMMCPIGTVRSRIFRARAIIGKHIWPLIQGDESEQNKKL